MLIDELFSHIEAEAGAFGVELGGVFSAVELLEDFAFIKEAISY
ncbi:MAG: hypothetical protein NUV64_03695 [Parcubacteria group bacterium]|nr:hypothetical protein [Parcubacteria group bacterium]MCR4342310.1 hypothetical protein [Patescibacteria group bacterium]